MVVMWCERTFGTMTATPRCNSSRLAKNRPATSMAARRIDVSTRT